MIKNEYFSNMAVGTEFMNCGTGYRKVSARKALNLTDNREMMVRAHMMGEVTYPDPVPPTAEEIAATRLRRVNNAIEDMLAHGTRAKDAMIKAMTSPDPQLAWFGTFTSSGAVEEQIKGAAYMHIATAAKNILAHPEGGIEELTRRATQNAMRYARFGHHSTSAVSNVAEEMQAAAWAEIAEACGVGRY